MDDLRQISTLKKNAFSGMNSDEGKDEGDHGEGDMAQRTRHTSSGRKRAAILFLSRNGHCTRRDHWCACAANLYNMHTKHAYKAGCIGILRRFINSYKRVVSRVPWNTAHAPGLGLN